MLLESQYQTTAQVRVTNVQNFVSSHSQMFFKINVLKDFAIFSGKHLCLVSFS